MIKKLRFLNMPAMTCKENWISYTCKFVERDRGVRATLRPTSLCNRNGAETRAEFKQMTGLGDKVAQMPLSRLLKTGLVETDSPLGPVRFGLPLDALRFYFPDL